MVAVGMRAPFARFDITILKLVRWIAAMVGYGGLWFGKTTLDYHFFYMENQTPFKSHCIIENIREESRKFSLKKLQGDILSALYKTKIEVYSVAEGKRKIKSMLCHSNVLENDQIEAIDFNNRIDLPHNDKIMLISKMKKLRWLRLIGDNTGNGEAPNCLSNELRYIEWDHYPANQFPDSFQAMNLIFLTLFKSKQKLLWKGYKK
ncbi:hypothetical protein Tco_0407740 [Tanacetum coccineum]